MKRADTAQRAQEIYDRLMALPRGEMSNNAWATKAGVNTSFFTGLRNGSEPSIGNLRAILEVVGTSLPEFFAHEAHGRIALAPPKDVLEAAIQEALEHAPRRMDRRAAYVAEVVSALLALPQIHQAIVDNRDHAKEGDDQELKKAAGPTL
jgi:hypothetical protein